MAFKTLITFLLLNCYALSVDSVVHEQVHLSLGADETEMIVTWTTLESCDESEPMVHYGKQNKTRDGRAMAERTFFVEELTKFHVYRAILRDLQPDTVYDYHVGDFSNISQVFSFQTLPKGNDWLPEMIIYGDLGYQEGQSVPYLREDIARNKYHAIFHIGDFAYDLHHDNGKVGHDFMNSIEPIAARIPYMTTPGNHEHHANFSHYDARFSMLSDRQKPNVLVPLTERIQNHFYSLDMGPAHIIVFSSEYYFYVLNFGTYHMERQFKWLEDDLKRANENRKERPWIIVMAHRPMYCFKRDDKSCNRESMEREDLRQGVRRIDGTRTWGLEDLFLKYGVDLQFYGHEHYYTRTLPLYNQTLMPYTTIDGKKNGTTILDAQAPIHIVTGSAGNKEHHPEFNPRMDAVDWVGFHQPDYGYTRVLFKDRLKIVVQQTSDDQHGKVTDEVEISKSQHLPAWQIASYR